MTYDEHVDCDRQLCEAEDKIIQSQAENKKLKKHIKLLQDCDDTFLEDYKHLQAENKKLKEAKEKLEFLCGFVLVDDCGCENCTIERIYKRIKELEQALGGQKR